MTERRGGGGWEGAREGANQANDLTLQAQTQIVPDKYTHTHTQFQPLESTLD